MAFSRFNQIKKQKPEPRHTPRKLSFGKQKVKNDRSIYLAMSPNKQLEESSIDMNCVYICKNLPADDVAPHMLKQGLLTEKEYEKYCSMNSTDYERSEYLVQCLLKRGAGFLRVFCEILQDIAPARHIASVLLQDYIQRSTLPEFERKRDQSQSRSDNGMFKHKVNKNTCSRCAVLEQYIHSSIKQPSSRNPSVTEANELQKLKQDIYRLANQGSEEIDTFMQTVEEIKSQVLSLQNFLNTVEKKLLVQATKYEMLKEGIEAFDEDCNDQHHYDYECRDLLTPPKITVRRWIVRERPGAIKMKHGMNVETLNRQDDHTTNKISDDKRSGNEGEIDDSFYEEIPNFYGLRKYSSEPNVRLHSIVVDTNKHGRKGSSQSEDVMLDVRPHFL